MRGGVLEGVGAVAPVVLQDVAHLRWACVGGADKMRRVPADQLAQPMRPPLWLSEFFSSCTALSTVTLTPFAKGTTCGV